MAGMVPRRARTAGLKREEGPVCVMGRVSAGANLSPLHAIDLPRPRVPQASHGTAQKCSQYKPTLKGIMLTCRNVC
jgi:hypothetical protein